MHRASDIDSRGSQLIRRSGRCMRDFTTAKDGDIKETASSEGMHILVSSAKGMEG